MNSPGGGSAKPLYAHVRQAGPIPLDAELCCEAGKVLALVGPSGSGKSTILRCIAGLYKPEHGKVVCSGATWLDTQQRICLPPQRRRVGMLFQDFALFPHLSALNNVRIALDGRARSARDRSARALLQRVHLQGLEERFPSALSGGQQQRVALARALAREPDVLLLDEPFSAVDQVTRRKLRIEMLQLTRDLKIPIVLVTHDLDEASMLADRLCVLHYGCTLQEGLPEKVMRHPANAIVARLIDVRNLFEAQVIEQLGEQKSTILSWQGYRLEAPFDPSYALGSRVCWCIPATDVLLHRRIQPSRGIRENPVNGQVLEIVTVAGVSNVIVSLQEDCRIRLHMDLPPHVVKRNIIRVGDRIGMSLLKNAIHLMAWRDLRTDE